MNKPAQLLVCLMLLAAPVRAQSAADSAAVVRVTQFARGLQGQYWDSLYIPKQRVPPQATILAHYRRGYTDSLARVYTAYALEHAPEPLMQVPERVVVVALSPTTATVAYETPPTLREIWNSLPFTIDELAHTPAGWRIVRTHETAIRPSGL